MRKTLLTSSLALSTAFAVPAMADVTAGDVWTNQQALLGAMGMTLSGSMDGNAFTGVELNGTLPMGAGGFKITTDDIMVSDGGNGTVAIAYPSPTSLTVEGFIADGGRFSVTMEMTHDRYDVLASGDAGDITYTSDVQNLAITLGEISFDGDEDFEGSGTLAMESWSGTSRVTEGNLITLQSESVTGETVADFTFSGPDGVTAQSTQNSRPLTSVTAATLPVGGSDLLNLSEALRNGLTFAVQSTGLGTDSTSVTAMDGTVINEQVTSTGQQDVILAFDEQGIRVEGTASDFELTMTDQMIFPGPITVGIEGITADYNIPVNASDESQDFGLAFGLLGLTLGEEIWALFDPAAQLPRDAADIEFDVTGTGTTGIDLLDFMALSAMQGTPDVEVDTVAINNVRITALGAEATAEGAFTFDWTDFQTIPGFARPEGAVTINLDGVNQLLDTLVSMGLVPEDQVMGPRMMMGMFATVVGDDQLESVIEVNDQGHVLANGQRLR